MHSLKPTDGAPKTNCPIRVVVADDHPIVREGLAAIVQARSDMVVLGEAANGQELVALCRKHRPDVVLTDLRMPVMDGVAAIKLLKDESPHTKVIVLSTYDGDEDIYRALRAGARSYLLKDSPREQLIETIRDVYAGQTRIPAAIATKLADRINRQELTPREIEVLNIMAAGKSNQEIGQDLFITEGTVKAHVNSILAKLGVSDRTQAVTAALKRGIVRQD